MDFDANIVEVCAEINILRAALIRMLCIETSTGSYVLSGLTGGAVLSSRLVVITVGKKFMSQIQMRFCLGKLIVRIPLSHFCLPELIHI